MPGSTLIRWLAYSAFVHLVFASTSLAQGIVTPDSSYFPLNDGYVWRYIKVLDPPFEPPDTLGPYVFSPERVIVNDTVYFTGAYPFPLADTIRTADDGNIYARLGGEDMLLFDFTLAASETYEVDLEGLEPYVVTTTLDDVVEVSAGTFEQTITLRFDMPNALDDENSYTFMRGTGIIRAYDGGGDYRELHEAMEPVSADPPELTVREFKLEAYPNPAGERVNLSFEMTAPDEIVIHLYDGAGRRVRTFELGLRAAGVHRADLDFSAIASGGYILILETGGVPRVHAPLILLH